MDKFVFKPEPQPEEFQLDIEGEYELFFTNGNSSMDNVVKAEVRNQNYKYFAITALGYAVPFGLKRLLEKTECIDETNELIDNTIKTGASLLERNAAPTTGELITIISSLGKDVGNASFCYLSGEQGTLFSKFFKSVIDLANKRLKIAEDIAEMSFLARDFFGSTVVGMETRYYSNGLSFGELSMQVNSPSSVSLLPETQIDFLSEIKEIEVSYDVERNLIESQFIKKENTIAAEGLVFNRRIVPEGTASFINGSTWSNDQGIYEDAFLSGTESGEIIIEPSFDSPDIDTSTINVEILTETDEELEAENAERMENYRWDFEYVENCTFSHTSSSFEGVKTTETNCPKLNKGYFNGTTFVNTDPNDGETHELEFTGNSVNFSYTRVEVTNTQETNLTTNYSYRYDANSNTFVGSYSRTYYSYNPISGSWLRYVWSGSSSLRRTQRTD